MKSPVTVFLIVVIVMLNGTSCQKPTASTKKEIAQNGVTESSSPTQVCELLLAAIKDSDARLVASFVAEKRVTQDFDSITRGKKNATFEKLRANAVPTAAAAIMLEMSTFKQLDQKIVGEVQNGDEADVTVEALSADRKPVSKVFHFVREDGCWKFVPSRRN